MADQFLLLLALLRLCWERYSQADLVVEENGKNKAEALASVAKGNETVEWTCSMPQLMQARKRRRLSNFLLQKNKTV